MAIRYEVDIGDVDADLRRLLDTDHRAVLALEAVLAAQFHATQQAVHIITGSLKGSGRVHSDHRHGRWTGQISYGGAAPGMINNPVVYARFEQRRRGVHDFMAPAEAFDQLYGAVIARFLAGRR